VDGFARYAVIGVLLVGVLALAVVFTRRSSATSPTGADGSPPDSAGGPSLQGCTPPANSSGQKLKSIAKQFFTMSLPLDWAETPTRNDYKFGEPGGARSVLVMEIPYPPTEGAAIERVLAFIVDQTRTTVQHTLEDSRFDPVRHDKRGGLTMACYRAQSRSKDGAQTNFFYAVAGRPTKNGGFRFASLYLESSADDVNAVDALGAELLASLEVSDEPILPEAGKKTPQRPIVTLTVAAADHLRQAIGKDEVLWVAVERTGPTGFTRDLQVKSLRELPGELEIRRSDSRGISIVVDEKSSVLLEDTIIDWDARADAFRFDQAGDGGRDAG
jgi:Fe-S cluster assembly iron-binding protein IscA